MRCMSVSRIQNVKQDLNVAFSRMFRNKSAIELSNPKYGSRRSGEAIQQMRVADFLKPNTKLFILWAVVTPCLYF